VDSNLRFPYAPQRRRARTRRLFDADPSTGEGLQAIVDLDLDELASIEPPRGFGRD
jgi:hypothetical protein